MRGRLRRTASQAAYDGADVLDEHADVHRKPARGDRASGEDEDELPFGALRIDDVERARPRSPALSASFRIASIASGLFFSIATITFFTPSACARYEAPSSICAGFLEHEAMVAREVRLAFGAVDDEEIDRLVLRGRELHVRRKGRASHADEAGVADDRL